MRKVSKKKVTEVVEETKSINCDFCLVDMKYDKTRNGRNGGTVSFWSYFGSKYDDQMFDKDMCDSCFEKLILANVKKQ
jgi:hypothetical protein